MPRRPWPRIVRGRTMRDVETAGRGVEARPLGGELGGAVGLGRLGHRVATHRVATGNPEHGARREVDDLADPGLGARCEQGRRPIDVDRAQQRRIASRAAPGRRSGTRRRRRRRRRTASPSRMSATITFDAVGLRAGRVDVEDADAVGRLDEVVDEQAAEVAVAASDQDCSQLDALAPGTSRRCGASPRRGRPAVRSRARAGPPRCRRRSSCRAHRARAAAAT